MSRLTHNPSNAFTEAIEPIELELHGEQARAFRFAGGLKDASRSILCIAGMGADGRSFARQQPLAKSHDVLSLNLPKETPPEADPLQFAVESLEEFVEQERLKRPVLLGASFGGAVAALATVRKPQAYSALVLAGAVLQRWHVPLAFPRFADVLEAPAVLGRLLAPAAVQIMGGLSLDREARDEIVREARHFSARELKRRLRALFARDLVPSLTAVRIPMLVVHGSRDWLVPWRRAEAVARKLPGARFELLRGAGHLPYLSHPDAFNEVVSRFLMEVEKRP